MQVVFGNLRGMFVRKWFDNGKRGVDYSQSESASSSTEGRDSFVDRDIFVTPVAGESDFAFTAVSYTHLRAHET